MNAKERKRHDQLGMPQGTASAILRKSILFSLLQQLELNTCFQCGFIIGSVDDLSIEHKVPWLDSENPKELYFSLDNIAFSHLKCNIGASRHTVIARHGTLHMYMNKGCRCDECKRSRSDYRQSHENGRLTER